MRKDDVMFQLKNAKEKIASLKKSNIQYKQDLDKIIIQEAINSMRTALDYMANDICDIIYCDKKNKKNIYFPYAENKEKFKKEIQRSVFKNLKEENREIYELIESIQDFNNDEKYLTELFKISNEQKHNRLSKQSDKIIMSITNDNCEHVFGTECTIFDDNSKIMVPSFDEGAISISMIEAKDLADYDNDDSLSINYNKSFHSQHSDSNIIDMLECNLSNIKKFKRELYKLL